MPRGRGGLGRGLESLFEDAARDVGGPVSTLPLREIEPDKDQPRKDFDEQALSELADSIARHGLPFRLIADTEHHLSEAMGTWVEKRMCGRTYMGMARTTFLVGPDGRVLRVYGPKQIKTKTHGEQLLHDLQAAAGGDPAAPQR